MPLQVAARASATLACTLAVLAGGLSPAGDATVPLARGQPEAAARWQPEGVARWRPEGVARWRPEGVARGRPEGVAPRPVGVAPRPVARYGWPLPVRPSVSRPFQPPTHPYGPGHRGADLVGHPGEPVLAAGDGVVVYAGPLAGRGVVSVQHADGLRTTYEPVAPLVHGGQRVARGQAIGTLAAGHLGCPAPACLHWGLRRAAEYLDPLQLVRVTRVRLLPWPPDGDQRGTGSG